eukprot:PhF_6_TR10035/c1_g1_i1/m.15407
MSDSRLGQPGPAFTDSTPIAGRRPQICPSWMTREEFEVCRNDPYRTYDLCQRKVQEMQQQLLMARKLNDAFMQDPQYQYAHAVQNFDHLKNEHIQLNDAYNDLETLNETLQEVIETLRGDKHQLLVELNALKREISIQSIDTAQQALREKQLQAFLESLDMKLSSQEVQVQHLEDESKEYSRALVNLANECAALEAASHTLSLQSTSLSELRQHLDTTRVSHERAIQALEREVEEKAQEIRQHDQQLWEFKKEMSQRVLALQKKAQECVDELGRLHRLSEHEMNTLATQNRALNEECKNKADALFAIRKERSDFSSLAKREINVKKEEIHQCQGIIDLVARQNAGVEASIARLIDQNRLSEKQIQEKDAINNKNLIEQANFVSMLHMELQSAREDLYLIKARLCHHCSSSILAEEENQDTALRHLREDAALQARIAAEENMRKAGVDPSSLIPSRTATVFAPGTYGSINMLAPDPLSKPSDPHSMNSQSNGKPMDDPDKRKMDDEVKRLHEALDAVQKQLLDERLQRERERKEEEEHRRQEEEERLARASEEEAKKKRQKEDERKAAAGEVPQTYTIRFVDGTRKKIDAFSSDLVGDVVQRVCAKLNIRHHEFFHIAHQENENSVLGSVDRFLDKAKSLEEERVNPKCTLVFKAKHYKRHVKWTDSQAQEWFYRQIQHNVVAGYYPATEKMAVELASYDLQKEFGDYSGRKRHSYFDRQGLDSYLPVTVSLHDFEYWQERFYEIHKARKGLSPSDARSKYIDAFSKSPYWGMTFFDIRDKENRPYLAGVAEDGLYILSANKLNVLSVMRFDDLAGWERSSTGVFIKKRGSTKMTLFASSAKQSKEMVDLLNEYYMMLEPTTRDRLHIDIDHREDVRSRVPPPETYLPPVAGRQKPVEYYSRLEHLKSIYMDHCLAPSHEKEDATRRQAIPAFTRAIDRALDTDKNLEELNLADCVPALDNHHLALIHDVYVNSLERYKPTDMTQWRDNLNLKSINFSQKNEQKLNEGCIENVCNFIRLSVNLTTVNLSGIRISNNHSADVTAALKVCPNLETLILRGCGIGMKEFQHILGLFDMVPTRLKTLDVENNLLNQSSMVDIGKVLEGDSCALTALNVGHNQIEYRGLEQLLLTQSRKRRLVSLNISKNPFGRDASKKIVELVSLTTGIVELEICQLELTGDKAVQIALELNTKGEIRKLVMSNNPIGQGLGRAIESGGASTRDLCAEMFAFLQRGSFCNITELVLDRCNLNDQAGEALAANLRDNTKLTTLVVSVNSLVTGSSGTLPQNWYDSITMNSFLTKLDMSYTGITYPGMMKMFLALSSNRGLMEVKLDGNYIDRYQQGSSHEEIVNMLDNNNSMRLLSLNDTKFHDDILVRIGEGLSKNRGITKFLAYSNEITVRGVSELVKWLPRNTTLQYMDLSCKSVQSNEDMYLQTYKMLIDSSNLETIVL